MWSSSSFIVESWSVSKGIQSATESGASLQNLGAEYFELSTIPKTTLLAYKLLTHNGTQRDKNNPTLKLHCWADIWGDSSSTTYSNCHRGGRASHLRACSSSSSWPRAQRASNHRSHLRLSQLETFQKQTNKFVSSSCLDTLLHYTHSCIHTQQVLLFIFSREWDIIVCVEFYVFVQDVVGTRGYELPNPCVFDYCGRCIFYPVLEYTYDFDKRWYCWINFVCGDRIDVFRTVLSWSCPYVCGV